MTSSADYGYYPQPVTGVSPRERPRRHFDITAHMLDSLDIEFFDAHMAVIGAIVIRSARSSWLG
jgi:hypothetical protein